MLRCHILSSPAWKVGKSSWQYTNKASFSNLPSSRLPSLRDGGFSFSNNQSILSPSTSDGAEIPPGTFKDPSAEQQSSSDHSNGTNTSTSGGGPQSGEPKLVAESEKAADTTEGARDRVELPLSSKKADKLLQKLLSLRSASRDILEVAKSAIQIVEKTSLQELSAPVSKQQDGIGDLPLEGNSTLQTTSSPARSLKSTRKIASKRRRKARGVIKSEDGNNTVLRKVVPRSSRTLVRKTISAAQDKLPDSDIQNAKSTETTPRKVVSRKKGEKSSAKDVKSSLLSARQLKIDALDVPEQPPVKTLSYDLERVLFKQGVYNLQDPRTGVFNFDHYLQNVMPAEEFDFDSLARFMSSSEDNTLQNLAKEKGKRYVGSTSSMTSVLSHFHFLLSNFRPLTLGRISRAYPKPLSTFTEFTRIPTSIFLRYNDGVYAVDSDKEFDRATILSRLGQSLEKLLTVPRNLYEQYRKTSPEKISEETKNTPEAYHYSSLANFVFRSQLDGRHDWLPGTGIFDIKTRACVTIRMDQENYKQMSGYQIRDLYGEWESYEREYLDMLRSTMLKYSLQVRMGRMDGIFVAYHNTEQIFGFQYVPLSEMDLAIHGQENLALGDQEFNFSVQMLSDVLDLVTEHYPQQSIRFHFETRPRSNSPPEMYIFAEPMDMETMDTVRQAETEIAIQELRNEMLGEASPARDNGTGEGVSAESEDPNQPNHVEEAGVPSEMSDASPEKPISVEEIEIATEAEVQLDDIAADPAASEEHNIELDSEAVSNNESIHSASPEEGMEDTGDTTPMNQRTGEDEDPSPVETGSENLAQDEPVLGEKKPILGFSLTVSHFVDGDVVKAVPSIKYSSEWPVQQAQYREGKAANVPPVNKTWNVSYRIQQFADVEARKLYQACQTRKRKKFEQLDQRDDYRDKYVRMLKSWSARGRSHKNKAEKVFSKDVKQVVP